MELSNVFITGASLDKALGWLQAAGANEKYPVTRMEFRGVQVVSDEIQLPLLNGRADFDAQGKFAHADLKSEDGKFGLELNSLQNRLQLELNIHESSLPVLTNIKFNDLSVNGVVGNGEVIFSDFFAHIHGGAITGKGQLNWSNGWKLQGQLNAKSLELQSMFPKFGVTGELYGDVNVSMSGSTLSQLDKDPRMEGAFEAKNGVVNKLDIDTIARFGTSQGGTGRTNFSELIGTLKADQHGQRFNLSKIAAGASAAADFLKWMQTTTFRKAVGRYQRRCKRKCAAAVIRFTRSAVAATGALNEWKSIFGRHRNRYRLQVSAQQWLDSYSCGLRPVPGPEGIAPA